MNISKKRQLVLEAIRRDPKAAEDDALLIATVWRMEGWHDYQSLEDNIRRVTHPETITRRRRELYNMGLISYDAKTLRDREEAFKNESGLY